MSVELSLALAAWKGRTMSDIQNPSHYGGADNPYEAIKVMRAWMTPEEVRGFLKGNALKYLSRAGKKDGEPSEKDYAKAQWYIRELLES